MVSDAGWIPNYDIKSEKLNAPVELAYKAHVYQKTGNNWENVNVNENIYTDIRFIIYLFSF